MINPAKQSDEFISLAEFREFMYHNVVPLKDLVDLNDQPLINSFPYWRRHELLPFISKGKWIKISFAQLIWVRMLDMLRFFGYPLMNTKKVCDYFFKDAYDNDLPERNIKQNRQLLNKKKLAATISDEELIMLDIIEQVVKDNTWLYVLKYDINYLTNLITSCISSAEEAGILIFQDGEVGEKIGSHHFSHRAETIDPTKPHIYLSVKYFLKEFIESEELNTLVIPQLLNHDEKNVLKELRDKNILEIIIKRIGEKDVKINTSTGGLITGEKANEIKTILGLHNYEEITISTRDEKTLIFKKKKKK